MSKPSIMICPGINIVSLEIGDPTIGGRGCHEHVFTGTVVIFAVQRNIIAQNGRLTVKSCCERFDGSRYVIRGCYTGLDNQSVE